MDGWAALVHLDPRFGPISDKSGIYTRTTTLQIKNRGVGEGGGSSLGKKEQSKAVETVVRGEEESPCVEERSSLFPTDLAAHLSGRVM